MNAWTGAEDVRLSAPQVCRHGQLDDETHQCCIDESLNRVRFDEEWEIEDDIEREREKASAYRAGLEG